jgi:hypothetical protein
VVPALLYSLQSNELKAIMAMSTGGGKTDSHDPEHDDLGAGVAADEATGQIPVSRVRKEVLPPEEQGSSDAHEPFGAEDHERKEKR